MYVIAALDGLFVWYQFICNKVAFPIKGTLKEKLIDYIMPIAGGNAWIPYLSHVPSPPALP